MDFEVWLEFIFIKIFVSWKGNKKVFFRKYYDCLRDRFNGFLGFDFESWFWVFEDSVSSWDRGEVIVIKSLFFNSFLV